MSFTPVHGGCQCGKVRYTLSAPAKSVSHCHCSMCRKSHGALFASFGVYDSSALSVDRGADALRGYESSPGMVRQHCAGCGGQLFIHTDAAPDTVFIAVGSLDPGSAPGHDPANENHIFWESRCAWYDPGDDLPKITGYGDDA